ncbi:hypothetical protein C922_04315 [Plasmodium inui San Antonio 1]|uniref:Uncharacterized protein n=1 Tax=Plasmodium inui San Antonio 1 TaxID=1237626 RepID=W7A134_9APIC|nr:hypothetical protein C922_04315 [Plasmodium inui San Antonio 1]EUD65370.1 hypothetical protein C922_04315 [Plasmodium inui San Antonio 1]
MERKGAKSRGKKGESFLEKNEDIHKEFLSDDLSTHKITNESKLFDEADKCSSHVGKKEDANIRKRQIGRKIKKVNGTNKFMEVRFYIFLVLLICFYSLLVNMIRKGLGFVSIAHRLMHLQPESISM